MHAAKVIYHYEPDGWWAESPNFPGFTAVGESFNEVKALVGEGLLDFCDDELHLVEVVSPLKSTDPLTSSTGLDSEPPRWAHGSSVPRQAGAWRQEDPARTASSDDTSREKDQLRNAVFV